VHRILSAFEIPRAGMNQFRPGSAAIAGGTLSHRLCLSRISNCLSGRELFPLCSSWGMLFPQSDHEVKQLAALVDSGEHNSHDANVSTEQRSDANCKGPK
jgi:hypothetical protein